LCAQNNCGEAATASALGKAALINPQATEAKALENFGF
jgi:hypothetical protein